MDYGQLTAEWTRTFRSMFYLCTPYETSYATIEEVPNYVTQSIPLFFVFTLLEQVVLWLQGKPTIRICDGGASIVAGLFHEMSKMFIRSMELRMYIWFWNNYRISELPWDSAWTWWLCLLGVDLAYYWFHRLAHEINIFWAVHSVHHSSEEYNMTTALRLSVLHPYLTWIFYMPLALCIPPSIFMVHVQFNLIYQFWLHTTTIGKLGYLEYFVNTPAHHRVHHGKLSYCIDKNFGGILMIWDIIFGSFQNEEEEVVYGVTTPINTYNPIDIQFCHFQHIWKQFWSINGWKHKLWVIFKGPGWAPGKPRLGLIEDIPDVHAPVEKYDPHLPVWLQVYYSVHFLLLLAVYHDFAGKHEIAGVMSSSCFMFFIFFTVYVIAVNQEMRPTASNYEVCRIVSWFLINKWMEITLPELMKTVIHSYFTFSAVMWLLIYANSMTRVLIKTA
uniref:Alkylglycerol monooxygenase n=1 Tax=Strigamia maritima TaxID=126957 RepID=T1IHS5_STRMM